MEQSCDENQSRFDENSSFASCCPPPRLVGLSLTITTSGSGLSVPSSAPKYRARSVVEAMDATDELEILLCQDADLQSAVQLSEQLTRGGKRYDLVVLCGPFTAELDRIPHGSEEEAVRVADISSIIAQFENVVCRVVYLPSDHEPAKVRSDKQLHLTPNSININRSLLPLCDNLFVTGFLEEETMLDESSLPDDFDRSKDSDDELEGVVLQVSSSVSMIETLMDSIASHAENCFKVFVLDFRFTSTVSQLLYHMPQHLDTTPLCIIAQREGEGETLNFPSKIGSNTCIVSPKSLRRLGFYYDIRMEKGDSGWFTARVDERTSVAPLVPLTTTFYA